MNEKEQEERIEAIETSLQELKDYLQSDRFIDMIARKLGERIR